MPAFILFIIINFFYLSKEQDRLTLYEGTYLVTNRDYYLDTSIYKKNDYIKFTIKFTISNSGYSHLYARFSNYLGVAGSSEKYGNCKNTIIRKMTYFVEYESKCDFGLKMYNTYKYLLIRFDGFNTKFIEFIHTNPPPCRAIHLNSYSSKVVKGSDYIAIDKNSKDGKYLYFSFSFENINNTNISDYKTYYSLENKYDDRFFKSLKNYGANNSRIKNNTYIFYYKLPLYDKNKPYICLKPGNETLKSNKITITHLLTLPYELEKSKSVLSTTSHDYIYTNISNISYGNEIYYKIVISSGRIKIKYKFSDENFYEDYTNMTQIFPKNKDIKNGNQIEYYNFTKENNSTYLLLEAQDDSPYSIQIYQTEKDEYQPPKIEEKGTTEPPKTTGTNKKALMISLICVGSVVIIAIIIFIIIFYRRRKLARMAYNEEKIKDFSGLMPAYPASYDTSMANPINE